MERIAGGIFFGYFKWLILNIFIFECCKNKDGLCKMLYNGLCTFDCIENKIKNYENPLQKKKREAGTNSAVSKKKINSNKKMNSCQKAVLQN